MKPSTGRGRSRIAAMMILMMPLSCVESSGSAEPDSTITEAPIPVCDDPIAAPGAFLDGMLAADLDFAHSSDGVLVNQDREAAHAIELSAGVVAADLDGDGFKDLFLPQLSGANGLYWGGGGGSYVAAVAGHGAELSDSPCQGASVADFDGDGLLDLLVLGKQVLTLLHNTGERSFDDVTTTMGLVAAPGTSAASAWADFDADGDLDVAVGNYGLALTESGGNRVWNTLWRNDGARFTEVGQALQAGAEGPGATLHMLWRDFDDDGDPDLLVLNDRGNALPPSLLLENLGGDQDSWLFSDRLLSSGTGRLEQPMGASVIDLDRDGQRDLWFSNIGRTQAFSGDGSWLWTERSAHWASALPRGVDDISWAAVDIDLSGSGDPALFFSYGPLIGDYQPIDPQQWVNQPDRFLRPEWDPSGELHFIEAPEVFPVEMTANSRGVARADLNGDGVPDLLVGRIDGPPQLLHGRCSESHRVAISLRATGSSNPFAIGARISVNAGGRSQMREVSADGPGPFSASDPEVLFGLGTATRIDRLDIRWPDGHSESFVGLCSHCSIRIERAPL